MVLLDVPMELRQRNYCSQVEGLRLQETTLGYSMDLAAGRGQLQGDARQRIAIESGGSAVPGRVEAMPLCNFSCVRRDVTLSVRALSDPTDRFFILKSGGSDGTRTRDLLRDRQAF